MGVLRRAAVAAALLAALPAARADLLVEPRPRQGYYIALGAHGALSFANEKGDGLGPMGGFLGTLRLGQMLTPRLGLGIAIDFGGGSGDGQSETLGGLAVAGQVEVVDNLAVHLAVGLGIVGLSSPQDDDDETRGVTGAAYTLGLTYDIFLGRPRSGGWALTPSLFLRAVPGETDAFALFFGVQLTRWTGLPKNQLALPPGQGY